MGMPLTIGSLCSGYEGLGMSVQSVLDAELAWVADPDPGAAKILAHHHPDVPNLGDITQTDWSTVPPVDILTAGFPCQDISNAGKRAGIEGERSGIWSNVADAIRVLRPRVVFLENVSAVVVRGLDRVVSDLAAVGYDASWMCLRASDVGAPHRRERWFCVAWPADAAGPRLEGAGVLGRVAERRGGLAADADHLGGHWGGGAGWEPQRHAAGAGAALAHADGDALRQQPVAVGGRGGASVTELPGSGWGTLADPTGVGHGHPRPPGLGGVPAATVGSDLAWGAYSGAIRRWEHVTGRPAPVPTEPGRNGQPRLSPVFVEWLMGLPLGWVTAPEIGLTRTRQLHALGNGVVPQQGSHALRLLLERVTADVAA